MKCVPMSRNIAFVASLLGFAALLGTGCPAPKSADTPTEAAKSKSSDPAAAIEAAPPTDDMSEFAGEKPQFGDEPAADPMTSPDDNQSAAPLVDDETANSAAPPTDDKPADDPVATADEPAGDPVDPDREALFHDWPQPQVAIFISGEMIGYIEPCGCAGLENMKGGLKRRHTLLKQLAERKWPVVPIDLGGQVKEFGRQTEIKYAAITGGLVEMGYRAVGLGPQDLRLPTEQIVSVVANFPADKNPLVSANVGLFGLDTDFVARFRVIEAGGKRIGVTSVLGPRYRAGINNPDLEIITAEAGLQKILPQLREQADFLILLSNCTPDESIALARHFPYFDIVVTAGGAEVPAPEATPIEGTPSRLVQAGKKGMDAIVLGLFDDPSQPLRYQRVPLDKRFADSPQMQQVLVRYQNELKTVGLAGLGVTARLHPTDLKFIGSESCADCHTKAHAVWAQTPHAHATDTLKNLKPPRHHDPECLSCHVTGWEPQKFQPFRSGFASLETTPQLQHNGCENCHGPGERHARAELGEIEVTPEQIAELRGQLRMSIADEASLKKAKNRCYECHDPDNSPDFDKKSDWYLKQIEHFGKN